MKLVSHFSDPLEYVYTLKELSSIPRETKKPLFLISSFSDRNDPKLPVKILCTIGFRVILLLCKIILGVK